MIVYPKNWRKAGVRVTIEDIEHKLVNVLISIGCKCLAFSGGLDASLFLYFMCQIFKTINVFTIGCSALHPDILFARNVAAYYRKRFGVALKHYEYFPSSDETKDAVADEAFPGDGIVKLFYLFVSKHADRIIAGDGADEIMCGYYGHMKKPDEATYYNYLRCLKENHLIPLDLNSDQAEVCLPFIDEGLVSLLSQIPLADKVDSTNRKRLMVEMAEGKVPREVIRRRKYGFCDALDIKEV